MKYAIKHKDGTFFKQWNRTGPCFGAKKEHARKFKRKQDALLLSAKHWIFDETEIVEIESGQSNDPNTP